MEHTKSADYRVIFCEAFRTQASNRDFKDRLEVEEPVGFIVSFPFPAWSMMANKCRNPIFFSFS